MPPAPSLEDILQRLAEAQEALVLEQRIANAQHRRMVEQQKMMTASVLRSEYRQFSNRVWMRLPMVNGDPLPDDVPFPENRYSLQRIDGGDLERLMDAYGLNNVNDPGQAHLFRSDDEKRKILEEFLRGDPNRR